MSKPSFSTTTKGGKSASARRPLFAVTNFSRRVLNYLVIRGRSHKKTPTLIVIEGQPFTLREYAALYGMSVACVQKRIERGTPLDKPIQRHFYERESVGYNLAPKEVCST